MRPAMWSSRSSKPGRGVASGGVKVAAQPTCMWAVALSTSKNDASNADKRVAATALLSVGGRPQRSAVQAISEAIRKRARARAPAAPRRAAAHPRPSLSLAAMSGIVVMKFGGTSVADAERLKRAARRIVKAREEGRHVIAVLSARGTTTDELLAMAEEVSPHPDPRELDMLLSTGERISCALCAMAINDLGHRAISLTGSQAGIVTDTSHTKARILDVRADRIRQALDEDNIVLVAGFQGVSTARDVTTLGRGGSDTTAVAVAA